MPMCVNSANDLESVAADCLRTDLGNITSLTVLNARSLPNLFLVCHIARQGSGFRYSESFFDALDLCRDNKFLETGTIALSSAIRKLTSLTSLDLRQASMIRKCPAVARSLPHVDGHPSTFGC